MRMLKPTIARFAATGATAALAAALGSALLPADYARADDIDLFLANSGEQYAPNLYIILDNSGNWQSKIDSPDGKTEKRLVEYQVLKDVFLDSALRPDGDGVKLRVGFGLFAHGSDPQGGLVWQHVKDLTESYQTDTLTPLFEYISDSASTLRANNAPYAMAMNEAYRYFAADEALSGTQDGPRGSNDPFGHDPNAVDSGVYNSPAVGNCGKNYVVFVGNGAPVEKDGTPETQLSDLGGVLPNDPIPLADDQFESNWSDEFARFMGNTDVVPDGDMRVDHEQNVRTYVINVADPSDSTRKAKSARALLKSMSAQGDGLYFEAGNAAELRSAFDQILQELFAINDVFAASTLPVSVNVRGTNLNQVYMGVFRPDVNARTRWQGNLKLYKLAMDEQTGEVFLADADGNRSQSSSTGFIRNTAKSYWTNPSGFWADDERGTPASASDSPDGEVVEKGGVHQRIRDVHSEDVNGDYTNSPSDSRTLLTTPADCASDACALESFDTSHSSVDAASLNVNDASEAELLVDWMHGDNNNASDTNDPDSNFTTAIRPTVHGDVLHSQPAVVNYGDLDEDGAADIYTFYGANDGILHAIRGGKEPVHGTEIWGFIPPEFFGRLNELRELPTSESDEKEYFADGAIGVYREDGGDGEINTGTDDRVIVYVTMRRGGRLLYALDVTDPDNPQYMWKLDSSQTAFGELGYTWSRPEVTQVRYDDGGASLKVRDVLVFGGGYDPDADDDGAAQSMGRAVFVVDAITGEPIWQTGQNTDGATHGDPEADMSYSIPSDVAVIDSDGDDYSDSFYVGDTGGQVWRGDLAGPPSEWAVYKLASDGAAEDGVPERKFLYPPDVVEAEDSTGRYHAVLLGSGDRTKPFEDTVRNRFYMFKDRNLDAIDPESPPTPLLAGDLYDVTTDVHTVTDPTALDAADGWYIDLLDANGEVAGEKVVTSAVTLGGTTFFSTNEPPPENTDNCSKSLGTARNYEISFEDGTAANEENEGRSSEAVGGGFQPSPVPVLVEINGELVEAVVAGPDVIPPPGTTMGRRNPVYWNSHIDD